MRKEIKNCGLIALNNLIDIQNISMHTLFVIARDNGVKLYPYIIDTDDIKYDVFPAIFHSENHFIYANEISDLTGFDLTGTVLSVKDILLDTVPLYELQKIHGKSWLAVGVGAVTAVSGIVKAGQEKKAKKKAAQEAANQKEVELNNVGEGLQVSTVGSDLKKEAQARLASTQTEALREGGTRAILGGAGRVTANSQDVNNAIGADLDYQQKEIDQVKAEDNIRIRGTKEDRANKRLAALSSQYNAANEGQQQGYGNVIQGLGTAGSALATKFGDTSGNGTTTTSTNKGFQAPKTLVPKNIGWKSNK